MRSEQYDCPACGKHLTAVETTAQSLARHCRSCGHSVIPLQKTHQPAAPASSAKPWEALAAAAVRNEEDPC